MNWDAGDLFATEGQRNAESLRRELADRSGQRLELTLTRNRVTMASVHFLGERHARVRLHEAFLDSPPPVRTALAGYLRARRRRDWNTVCAFARTIRVECLLPRGAPRGSGRGRIHDLGLLAREVNRLHFQGRLRFRVEWGRNVRVVARRSIRYGSCNPETGLIRIHPLLDDDRVPEGFVRYILFHELLHLAVPAEQQDGRRQDHSVNFRRLERTYPDVAQYKQLARELLAMLAKAQ